MKNKSMVPTIDERYCKGCNLCVEVCPKKVYSPGHRLSDRNYIIPHMDPEKCVNKERPGACNLCVLICPDQAIWLEESDG